MPIPDGIIEGGNVQDMAQLAKTFKTLRRRHRVRSARVGLALPVRSTLARVVSLPESDPQRITQFLKDEVRQYAVFSGRETVSDHRVLAPATGSATGKALVAAAEQEAYQVKRGIMHNLQG